MTPKLSNNKALWLLSAITGIAMWLAWPDLPFVFLLFIGFAPILLIEDTIARQHEKFSTLILFEHVYVAFVLWNALTTWWMVVASPVGAIVAILANAFLMSLPVLLFHKTRQKFGNFAGYTSFIAYWLTFEYLHHQWELTWPWLTLGNGLAKFPELIQWYEYTGVFGGSLWILLVNLALFVEIRRFIIDRIAHQTHRKFKMIGIFRILLIILLPALLSYAIYRNHEDRGVKQEIVVIQPNVDPYNEKFNGLTPRAQLKRLIDMSLEKITPATNYLVWPETALNFTIWVDKLDSHSVVQGLKNFISKRPNATLITGIYAYKNYPNGNGVSPTARNYSDGKCCYDAYNSAIQIDTTGVVPIYHKSRLVPGVERMPYPKFFSFLNNLAIDLGGITGSLGTQKRRDVFVSQQGFGIAPVICYESVFGEYVSEYIKNGANAIFIITNDGWWGKTPGHLQHLRYASMRAIETRRSIARSANTGISCFINQRGDILQATKYDEQIAIRGKIAMNNVQTFYTHCGDLLGKGAVIATLFFVLSMVVGMVVRRKT
ncbi:MAG: apolipoprotein N-acyltransferase [bacterium]